MYGLQIELCTNTSTVATVPHVWCRGDFPAQAQVQKLLLVLLYYVITYFPTQTASGPLPPSYKSLFHLRVCVQSHKAHDMKVQKQKQSQPRGSHPSA